MKTNRFIQTLISQINESKSLLVENETSYTAEDILKNSLRLADSLKKIGFQKGHTAIIASQPGAEFVQIIFASMMIGLKVALIDPEMGRENYKSKIEQLKPQWYFIDYRLMLLQEHILIRYLYKRISKSGIYVPYDRKITSIATGKWLPVVQKHHRLKNLVKKGIEGSLEGQHDPKTDFIVTYTSGTISSPKGVMHSFQSIGNSIGHIRDLLGESSGQSIATHLPHYMLLGVCSGIKVLVWDAKMTPTEKLSFIKRHQISTIFGPPSEIMEMVKVCESQQTKLPDCVKHIIMGSAPIHVPFLQYLIDHISPNTNLTCMYGMTEHLVVSTIDGRHKASYQCDGDVLGRPVANVEVKIADDHEILLRSDQLYTGYLNQGNRSEWHPTGDLGYLDGQGNIVMIGRKKDMIIRRDFNLYPSLYEPTIKKIDGVEEAVIVGKYSDSIADEVVYLFIQTQKAYTEKQIMDQLRQGKNSIDHQALPDKVIFCDIPRKGRQEKIDKNTLRSRIQV